MDANKDSAGVVLEQWYCDLELRHLKFSMCLCCILYQCGLVIFVYGNFILVSVIQMCTMYTLVGFVLIIAFYKNKIVFSLHGGSSDFNSHIRFSIKLCAD